MEWVCLTREISKGMSTEDWYDSSSSSLPSLAFCARLKLEALLGGGTVGSMWERSSGGSGGVIICTPASVAAAVGTGSIGKSMGSASQRIRLLLPAGWHHHHTTNHNVRYPF
jgi:hypothetical protein